MDILSRCPHTPVKNDNPSGTGIKTTIDQAIYDLQQSASANSDAIAMLAKRITQILDMEIVKSGLPDIPAPPANSQLAKTLININLQISESTRQIGLLCDAVNFEFGKEANPC